MLEFALITLLSLIKNNNNFLSTLKINNTNEREKNSNTISFQLNLIWIDQYFVWEGHGSLPYDMS